MDVSNAIIAKSDQLNSTDLIAGPQTVTIVTVNQGNTEQPVNIITDVFGPGRPFKPSKTVLRILAAAWGKDTTVWVGRRMTVYRDPTVRWANEAIGGIRVKALSHIDKEMVFNLPVSKGKNAKSTIEPLPDAAPERDWLTELTTTGGDIDLITALGKAAKQAHAAPAIIAVITQAYHDAKGES
ncbi:hypothetical protein [Agromyces cerinus]|uniref:Uncharacterized protein n=1 Tax=Agromyces cerinus subsp. cerinus TaxID=232089 RepID=A0A1N6DPA9_9MICO|nr:hypothetical protein [Agromyces cerinus]SIN72586.1 hypothetical protein SAMN05443544_0550 [Agromyces cerinus subsp. cerinus]